MSLDTTSPTLSHRCAPWTRAQGIDPIGTAPTCDTLVLVEVPPPWPRDVTELPVFAGLRRRGLRRTRLLAVRPADGGPGEGSGTRVTVWRRDAGTGRFAGTDHLVPAGHLADLVEAPEADAGRREAPAEVLLCGHGARDGCCGRLGTRLVLDVAAAWPDVRVRRCSHTSGHRFAPTGFTLPDGRAWGFLDTGTLDTIVRRSGPPPLRGHYRGDLALDAWAQVAERELFERFGWDWSAHRLTSSRTEIAPGGRSAAVELAWHGPHGPGAATATVDLLRDVPVLVCGRPPEAAEKTAPELALRSIAIR
ncbi:sucrase ferredoxin [Actinomadura rugatobispora]|uniref:Sucrase ferredoxin n=1 Tax=Actinomadura rugatobispora TaxID=1994 RepID=A0ABW1AFB6_9ACTN|nr:hypothetical protein GCM10010200_078440 [Actinomadura rugatobispora]